MKMGSVSVAAFGLAVVFAGSSTASAASVQPMTVQKTGHLNCGGGARASVTVKGTGTLRVWAPPTVVRYETYHSSDFPSTWNSNSTTLDWKATSDGGYLDDPGTFGWCKPPDALARS